LAGRRFLVGHQDRGHNLPELIGAEGVEGVDAESLVGILCTLAGWMAVAFLGLRCKDSGFGCLAKFGFPSSEE
jgi:hypothetical protein